MSFEFQIINDELIVSQANFVDPNVRQAFSNALNTSNTRTTSVIVKDDNQIFSENWNLILENPNIKKLTLSNIILSRNDASKIAGCIQENQTLKELIIHGTVTEYTFEVLSLALDQNKTLIHIEFDDIYKNDIVVLQLMSKIERNKAISRQSSYPDSEVVQRNNEIVSVETPMLEPVKTVTSRQFSTIFPRNKMLPLFLVSTVCFLCGLLNSFNGVFIRQLKNSFVLTKFQAGLVFSVFYIGYFLWAIPAALLMRKVGYKAGLVTGLFVSGTGALLVLLAGYIGQYLIFLIALFIITSGLSFLETASNPFIVRLGDPVTSEQRLNFSQAFTPLGAIIGVFIGTIFIFSDLDLPPGQVNSMKVNETHNKYLENKMMGVTYSYIVLGVIAFILAIIILIIKFPKTKNKVNVVHENEVTTKSSESRSLRHINFIFAVIAQLLNVGVQIGTWSHFTQYAQNYTGISKRIAEYWMIGTLAAFSVGRFSSVFIMEYVRPDLLMGLYSLINCVLVGVGVFLTGWSGMLCIFFTSFFMSVMLPTTFAIGLKGLSSSTTKIASSILVMTIVGGAALTLLMDLIIYLTKNIAQAYLVPFIVHLFIALYSLVGVRLGATKCVTETKGL
ncbi:unnamed protein product [Didymodactylos carnosus]|uniref:Uncharacterized protein n=1 Tax=Didymodactylos carnosus TaxID=1234261 RepID=A0A813X9H7_9BILA|nr:unnamed protein product [Didymodactylos carnosus]CAF1186380.1 unnamed protein product [Didymodactylos carnosus]CAF3649333.1 unnamed protein product [Didymodactylos carnosus]CAF3997522.1 unnamed protein product [Didymodactylos carnosus]